MSTTKFLVRKQNPPLISMLGMIMSIAIIVSVLDSWLRIAFIIMLVLLIGFFIYRLIWFIRNRNKYHIMELNDHELKIGDKHYDLDDIKKIIVFENILNLTVHRRWGLNIYYIKQEEKLDLINKIKEVTGNRAIQTRFE